MFIFFFKQKTAYEMRISDWSSDVCSSDLGQRVLWRRGAAHALGPDRHGPAAGARRVGTGKAQAAAFRLLPAVPLAADAARHAGADRKSVVSGKSVSVRVDLGGRRVIKKNKHIKYLSLLTHNQLTSY